MSPTHRRTSQSYSMTDPDTESYDTESYDTESYDTESCDTESYDTESYDTDSYDTGVDATTEMLQDVKLTVIYWKAEIKYNII